MFIRKPALIGAALLMMSLGDDALLCDTAAVDSIARSVFVGQAYASGNVYVKAFSDGQRTEWPTHVVATHLRPAGGHDSGQRLLLMFSRVVNAAGSDEYSTFPTSERPPGENENDRPPDLFSTVLDAALEDRDIAAYRTNGSIAAAFPVLAWDAAISLDRVDFHDHGRRRPMTRAESHEVSRMKEAVRTETKGFACTTEPAFLDSAKEILTATMKGSALSIRISEYSNAGCAGHLEEVYVLDVREDGKEPRRFEYHHYAGAI